MYIPSRIFLVIFLLYSNHSLGGSVQGTIRRLLTDKNSSSKKVSAANVVVYVTGFEQAPTKQRHLELNQKNKQFTSKVLVVTRGETVEFKNEDEFYHNVWSLSEAKKFDLGQYKAPEVKSVNFDKAGLVKVFCNIHPEMISTVLVLKNDKYFITKEDGSYSITQIPAGKWDLRVWAEGMEKVEVKKIEVTETSNETVDFVISIGDFSTDHLNKEGRPYSRDY